MILKRPYILMIKYFRLIHLLLTMIIGYSFYKTNNLLKFFNEYIVNDESIIENSLKNVLFNNLLFIFIVLIIIVTILLLFTMLIKKKPFRFYLYNLLVYLFVLGLFIYISSFFGKVDNSIVDIVTVRALRDLLLVSLFAQGISFLYGVIRIFGFDLKKFDFASDIEINKLDNGSVDEIEVSFDFDSNERKRLRKQKFSDLKFAFKENRILIFIFLILFVCIFGFIGYKKIYLSNKIFNKGDTINTSFYNLKVNNSYLINTSMSGKKITNNYLVVVDINIKTKGYFSKFISGNMKLHTGDNIYSSISSYNNYLLDIGNYYNDNDLTIEGNDYFFVYEIDSSEVDNKLLLYYDDGENNYKIRLEPILFNQDNKEFNIGDDVKFDDNNSLIINAFDVQETMFINYDLCLNDVCHNMRQNIVPTLNTNYDKAILKLDAISNFAVGSSLRSFSYLLANYGSIEYVINNNSYYSTLESVNNLNKKDDNFYYYEVNKEVMNADNIYLVINTRKCKYRFKLK